ncbi:MAG: Rab family GTPase, partial [Promethearchaeota archaeon]
MADEYDYLFKSIVVGDGGVGKTALTLRFSKGFFTEDYKMTIGVDFHVKTISIDTSEGVIKCKLQLWDTGGQERFSSIRPMYYRGSLGTVLVFDLTNSASFEHLPQWIEEVRANIKAEIPVLLVGNKSDLIDQRAVSVEEISRFTNDFNLYYMETSAKTGDGVGDCFYILACLMIGQGVPEQLVANATVYAPGQVIGETTQISAKKMPSNQPKDEYIAPPVPEPTQFLNKQPEIEYEAPPV